MKIAIPMEEKRLDAPVCVSFGRAPYFLIRDTDGDTTEFLDNPAASATGGAGIKAAQFIADQGVNALITVRAGQNAAEVISQVKMQVLKATDGTAEANLKAFTEGKLPQLTQFHAGFHGRQ